MLFLSVGSGYQVFRRGMTEALRVMVSLPVVSLDSAVVAAVLMDIVIVARWSQSNGPPVRMDSGLRIGSNVIRNDVTPFASVCCTPPTVAINRCVGAS